MSGPTLAPRANRATVIVGITVVAALAAIVAAGALHDRGMAVDDAFISFRYARNLAEGHGLRWNPESAPCEGYTNFLYVAIVALGTRLGVEPPAMGLAIGVASAVATILLLASRVRGRGAAAPLVLAMVPLFLARPELRIHASRGLETLLFGVLAMIQLDLAGPLMTSTRPVGSRALVLGIVLFLLCLCRPDGVLLVGCTCAFVILGRRVTVPAQDRQWSRLSVGVCTLLSLFALYLGWKWRYFGYLLPNSYYAKARSEGWPGVADTASFLREYRVPLLIALGVLTVHAFHVARTIRTRALTRGGGGAVDLRPCLGLATCVVWLVYCSKIVHEMGFDHRFAYPVVPIAAAGAALALRDLLSGVRPRPIVEVSSTLVGSAAWLLAFPFLGDEVARLRASPEQDRYTSMFRRLGTAIRDAGEGRDLTLVCSHAGVTPYEAQAHHVDPGGLVDDGFCARSTPAERWRYRQSIRPDVICSHLFPASDGAESFEEDLRAGASAYLVEWCFGSNEDLDALMRHDAARRARKRRLDEAFEMMVFFRDHCTLVGEMFVGDRRWREFVYVWGTSPHHDALVARLRAVVDVPGEAITYGGWPE